MSNRQVKIIATCLLIFVFLITILSARGDSATMDEVAHLPAGYSYLTQKDMRLNPEHPPLIKDLAAIPLLFIKGINFPSQIKDWAEDINGQWGFGFHFLYKMGNPADKMIFASRIPMILMLVFLGFFIFKTGKEYFGEKAALLALILFSFSPTFLAHGRLVTTDIASALGILISTYYFLAFLEKPKRKNIILTGVSLAFALLVKFNTFLLIPYFGVLIVIKSMIESFDLNTCFRNFLSYCLNFILVLAVCFFCVWLVYLWHVINYPPDLQIRDIEVLMSSHQIPMLRVILVRLARVSILRPLVQYFFGLSMVFQRASFGHTTYFLGEVSAAGWRNYFPVVYSIKVPLSFHILTIVSLLVASLRIKEPFWRKTWPRFKSWAKDHFEELSFLFFIVMYWMSSLISPLNIGVRHLLPVFPLTILLVSKVISESLSPPYKKAKCLLLTMLILWQAASVIFIYPYFLSYFNEIVGGPTNGHKYVVNSNLDWGQDLKRLVKWVELNNIEKIYVSYFGGGDAEYYLKEKFMPWWGTRPESEFEKPNYLAVSASSLQGGKGIPSPGFNQDAGFYLWLDKYEPISRIGYSIFVYYID